MKRISVYDWQEGGLKTYTIMGDTGIGADCHDVFDDMSSYPPGYELPVARDPGAAGRFLISIVGLIVFFVSGAYWLVLSAVPEDVPMMFYDLAKWSCIISGLTVAVCLLIGSSRK